MNTLPLSEVQLKGDHPKGTYRPDIDGLRAFAILAVVAYHAGIPGVGGGFVGVDIFFVISGYLITSIIRNDIDKGKFSIAKFYARRAKRILPALFFVLLFCYLLASLLMSPAEMRAFADSVLATIFSSSNVLFWQKSGYFAPNSDLNPLLMTWSLGVEEQFYLFFPLLMFFLSKFGQQKRKATIFVILVFSFALSVWGTHIHPTASFYLLPTRAWELAVGALIAMGGVESPADWKVTDSRLANAFSILGVGSLAAAVFFYNQNTIFPGLAAMYPVVGTMLLIMTPGSWVNRIVLSSKPMVFIGLVSYSWYLWHWPLLSFARILSERINIWATVTIALISFLVAIPSNHFIEQPFRRMSGDNNTILKGFLAFSLAMALPIIVIRVSDGWPARFQGLSEIEATGQLLKVDPCVAGWGKVAPNLSSECAPSNPSNDPGVALLGDSHAAALADALRQSARNNHFRLLEITKALCPNLVDVTPLVPYHPSHDRECAAFNKKTLDLVERDESIKVVILAGFWTEPLIYEKDGERFILDERFGVPVSPIESRDNLKRGLQDTVKVLQSSGKSVIVVKDNPIFDFDPVRQVRETFIKPRMFLVNLFAPTRSDYVYSGPKRNSDSTFDDEVSAIIDDVAASNHAATFDLKKTLCNENSCFFYDGKSLLYKDNQHLTLTGAERGLAGFNLPTSVLR